MVSSKCTLRPSMRTGVPVFMRPTVNPSCALVISVPLSFFGGIGGASSAGILVKGSNYLEALSRTEVVVLDKTGTLTQGTFQVTAIHPEGLTQASSPD